MQVSNMATGEDKKTAEINVEILMDTHYKQKPAKQHGIVVHSRLQHEHK